MNRKLVLSSKTTAAIVAILFLHGCGTVAKTRSGPGIDVTEDSVAYVRVGTGSPVVALQAGHQDGKKTWANVVPQLSKISTVISADRPGHGGNRATDAPRDPCTIATEQHSMLVAAGVQPPYILVGHSLGGLYQYVYAKMYPNDVAGLVLLDPTHPQHWEALQRNFPLGSNLIKAMRVTVFSNTDRKEFDAQTQCLNSLNMSQPLNIPTKLLFSGRFRSEERGDYENMLKPLREDWQRLVGSKQVQTVWDSGHYIQKDSPEEVVEAVHNLILETKQRR